MLLGSGVPSKVLESVMKQSVTRCIIFVVVVVVFCLFCFVFIVGQRYLEDKRPVCGELKESDECRASNIA